MIKILIVVLMSFPLLIGAQLRFQETEIEYNYVFFMTSVPVNFMAWSFDSSKLKLQGTTGYNAIFLLARGDGELERVNSIAGAGVGVIVGYGDRPVLGVTAVLLISEVNTFFGYDFIGRGPVIGVGYTVSFPFPKRAYITLWRKEVIK